ncbi:dihydrofolate reductase family protein [Aspergillus undulatus]|uniref:dihydrofolate reductase family protein n=1 Tax=Aspergillus undulatus TaxID=1810928 RepID=UPI003CCC99DC
MSNKHRPWKTRLYAATSLDGLLARANNDITWLTQPPSDPDHTTPSTPRQTPTFEDHIAEVDFIVMGRVTFEVCCSFPQWPYPERKILVLSETLEHLPNTAPQGARIVRSIHGVEKILNDEGAKMVYVDGGKITRDFLRRGWVDEMVLTLAPVLLGAEGGRGSSLFGFGVEDGETGLNADMRFTLLGVDVIENGMVSCWYRVTGA